MLFMELNAPHIDVLGILGKKKKKKKKCKVLCAPASCGACLNKH